MPLSSTSFNSEAIADNSLALDAVPGRAKSVADAVDLKSISGTFQRGIKTHNGLPVSQELCCRCIGFVAAKALLQAAAAAYPAITSDV